MSDNIYEYTKEYNNCFLTYKGSLDFVDEWFLMSTPFPTIIITLVYLLVVLKLGPDHMKKRQPYDLKNILVLYNGAQVIISSYLFYLCNQIMLPNGFVAKTCLLESEDNRQKISKMMYFYFLAKISELLDTVFFILRKKDSQVTFLHVYHHAVMIVASWGILKYEPTYNSIFIRNINSLVHMVMYTYYGLSAFPGLAKYLWWKKYITGMQLVQFSLIMVHFIMTYITSECRPSYPLCFTIIMNTTLFFCLFSQFYINSYSNKSKPNKIKGEHEKSRNGGVRNGFHKEL